MLIGAGIGRDPRIVAKESHILMASDEPGVPAGYPAHRLTFPQLGDERPEVGPRSGERGEQVGKLDRSHGNTISRGAGKMPL